MGKEHPSQMIQLVQRPWGGARVLHCRKKARVSRVIGERTENTR